jgi:hypothetical protein
MPRMDRHEHQHHAIDAVDASRDNSLPLSDSVIPISFEFVTESSPESSSGSDVFHTPEASQLDIEESLYSAEVIKRIYPNFTRANSGCLTLTPSLQGIHLPWNRTPVC